MKKTELNTLVNKIDNIEALANDLRNAADEAEVEQALAVHGLNITLEDMVAIAPVSDELTEDDLLDVAGGCKCGGFHGFVNNFIAWLFGCAGIDFKCANCGQ